MQTRRGACLVVMFVAVVLVSAAPVFADRSMTCNSASCQGGIGGSITASGQIFGLSGDALSAGGQVQITYDGTLLTTNSSTSSEQADPPIWNWSGQANYSGGGTHDIGGHCVLVDSNHVQHALTSNTISVTCN